MESFDGKLAVITGAGTGMGRELALQLSAEGCALSLCDLRPETLRETVALCEAVEGVGAVSSMECDVADEASVQAFRNHVLKTHRTDHIHLLFNNAGIGGGGSFLNDPRDAWERTFDVNWRGVYLCSRAFLPLLVASDGGVIVNTSSINGFWASMGPHQAHTAYSAAKFAIKGFTEALQADLRLHAPHVSAVVVMPGHIGTPIVENSYRALNGRELSEMTEEDLQAVRRRLSARGVDHSQIPDAMLRDGVQQFADRFRNTAPTSAAEAATIILDGVRQGRWRVLVGADAEALDAAVRADPEAAYETAFLEALAAQGHFEGMTG